MDTDCTTDVIEHVAAHLRDIDRRELLALGDSKDPVLELRRCVEGHGLLELGVLRHPRTNEPVAIYGLAEWPGVSFARTLCPWLLVTTRFRASPRLLRLFKRTLKRWRQQGPLFNLISTENSKMIVLLRRCGAHVPTEQVPLYFGGERFYPFYV